MPFVDGLELAAYISESYPRTKTILLTGYDEFEYAQEAVKLRVNDFLLKPITADELRELLDRVRGELESERKEEQDLDRLREQLSESLPILRERFLNRLIRSAATEAEIRQKLGLLDLELPGPCYVALVVDPDQLEPEDELSRLAVQNTVSDSLSGRYAAVTFRTPREETVVLLSVPRSSTAQSRAIECAEVLSEAIENRLDTPVSIGAGYAVEDLRELESSYREARTALDYRLVLGPNQIVTIQQLQGSNGRDQSADRGSERSRLIASVKRGSSEETRQAVRDIVTAYRESGKSIEECSVAMQRLLADLLNAFEALGVTYDEILGPEANPFRRLGELKTLDAVEQWFCDFQQHARDLLASRREEQSKRKAVEAEEYIATRYTEPGFSLGQLCAALSVSKSYFSAIFKAHTGMTFVEYLTHLRTERAKELLQLQDMKSYEVAERVGFRDPHYFSLTFKKQTGQSPTEYRELWRSYAG
jgi:two-component system response regulator YesN